MGVCLSCLGLNRKSSNSTDERTRLLQENQADYDSLPHDRSATGQDLRSRHFPNPSPERLQRERDGLERACITTSDKLIDVSPQSTIRSGHRTPSQQNVRNVSSSSSQPPQPDATRPETSTAQEAGEDDSRSWLRSVLEQDPMHKRWDPQLVPNVPGNRVSMDFEEAGGGKERPGSAKQALKEAIS